MTIRIEISDEVNCKITGLDLHARKALVNKFKFQLPYARHLPSVRLGRWDGCKNFFALGGSTYINLLPEILPILEKYDSDIELVDHRQYTKQINLVPVDVNSYNSFLWPEGHRYAGQPIELREDQAAVINNFCNDTQSMQEVATGAGKTLVTAILSHRCEDYGRTIVIVPNKSLVTQTETDYKVLGLDVGVYFGDRKEFGKKHTICTWQSLGNLLKNTKDGTANISIQDFLEDVICVMVDECFHGESLILTPAGYVPIKDIKQGDIIINYSESTKQFKSDIVVKQHINLMNSNSEKMYELEFDNGNKIKVTGNHKFLTNLGWCRADELTDLHEIINKT